MCAPRRWFLRTLAVSSIYLAIALPLGAITVTSLGDSGPGTLRAAIEAANSDGIPTTIDFAPGLAGGTIALASQLPDLNEDDTTIDGDFEGDCDPDIGIDGSSAGPGADGSALTSNNHVVRGLAFFDFDGDGLHVQGSNNLVECNYFGTDLAQAGGHGNGQLGIRHVAENEPAFESRPGGPGQVALVTVYDEATAPLLLGFSSSRLRQRVATLIVQLAPAAPAGTTLDLRLDPGTTLLSNQAGTTHESVPNGWLELADGRLTIAAGPTVTKP